MEAPCSTRNGINIKILPMFVFSSIKKIKYFDFFYPTKKQESLS